MRFMTWDRPPRRWRYRRRGWGWGCTRGRGFWREKAREIFAIPEGYEAVTGIVIGYPGEAHTLPDPLKERELEPRARKPLDSFVFTGKWGKVSPLVRGKS